MSEREQLQRLTTKLLREIGGTDAFGCRSDLKEALKTRLAQLRIPYNLDTVEGAIDRVERRRPWTRKV